MTPNSRAFWTGLGEGAVGLLERIFCRALACHGHGYGYVRCLLPVTEPYCTWETVLRECRFNTITSTAPLDLNMSFHLGEERGISVSLKHSSVCCQHFLLFQAENNDQTLIYFSYPPSPGQRGLQPMIVIIDSCFICFYFSILNEIYASQSSQSPKWRLECFVWSNQQQPTTLKPYAFISQQHSTWNSKSPHFLKHPNERMFVIFVLVKHIFRRGVGLKSMWFVKSYNFPVVKIHQHVKTLHGKNINTWSPLIFPTQWIYSSLFSSTLAAWLRYFSVIIHQRELSTAVNQDKRTWE